MQDYTKLKVWEKAHGLTIAIYRMSKSFPREEMYGLTSQIRRAAASIPMNLAEGCGRRGPADKARFFEIAYGSASETEYQILLSHDIGYLPDEAYRKLSEDATEIKRMLAALIKKLRTEN